MDALGSTRSAHTDAQFSADLRKLSADAKARGNEREALHAEAIENFAHG